MKHITQLRVQIAGQTVGKLATDQRGRIYFQYDAAWLQTGFDLSPHTLAFHAQTQLSPEPQAFRGLHGVASSYQRIYSNLFKMIHFG